jgi:aminopeptidase N
MRTHAIATLVTVLLLAACAAERPAPSPQPPVGTSVVDPHSFANLDDVTVRHLSLDLEIDFEQRQLHGHATLELADHVANHLVLDTRDLDIERVRLDDGTDVDIILGEEDPLLGRSLTVPITPETVRVTVHYSTRPEAEALQWLPPELTAGGEHPFLFSQSQAILARTWVPCQDSPAVRMTYDATLRVPAGLMAVMSATNGIEAHDDGVYTFSMRQPIPSYLLALAVGDLEFRPLGPRTGVYAEPPVVAAAAWEFADTERMMDAAERLYGPYRWERYDILVLPPSFPFGGMENPRLTFATPTILAGDRSLVALVAHELAHSWSGNLVTNATWNDFWLNEGFTSYIENRLMEELYGVAYAEMLAALDLASLRRTLSDLEPDSVDSHLVFDLAERNPDDGMTDVAYNKGASFLRSLERQVGRERWDEFLNDYFQTFAFQSIDTPTFLAFLDERLLAGDAELARRAQTDAWVYGPGLPDSLVEAQPAAFAHVGGAVGSWQDGTAAADLSTDGWTTHHWLHFLQSLPEDLSQAQMTDLDSAFGFTESGNSEILATWLGIAVREQYTSADPALESFLMTVGRIKFLTPLYQALLDADERDRALEIYERARNRHHPVTVSSLDRLLAWEGVPEPAASPD